MSLQETLREPIRYGICAKTAVYTKPSVVDAKAFPFELAIPSRLCQLLIKLLQVLIEIRDIFSTKSKWIRQTCTYNVI